MYHSLFSLRCVRTHGGMSATLEYSGTLRSCGGPHTTTHPHRRLRVAPLK